MARRLFRGRAFSENGWPYVDQGSCTWDEVVPGVWLQIQNGAPFTIMRAFARDFHAHVEPLRDYDSACWTQDNTVDTSNHPGGTGMDLNWNGADQKTFRYGITKERAYPGDKARKLDELLAFYEDVIYCGGYWSIRDWMHFQMGYGTYDSKADRPTEKTLDFIRRKIRPDGFSTFNRGGGTTVPNGASVLARATGIPLDRAERILPALREGLILAECNTFPRIAMFLAQTCWESDQYRATEEYANGPAHEERWIYKGRTWIQLTWRSAYEALASGATPEAGQRPDGVRQQPTVAGRPEVGWPRRCVLLDDHRPEHAEVPDAQPGIGRPRRAGGDTDRQRRHEPSGRTDCHLQPGHRPWR